MGHDSAGNSPSWHLEALVITHESSGRQWSFGCDLWFDSQQGDGLTQRDLFPVRWDESALLCLHALAVIECMKACLAAQDPECRLHAMRCPRAQCSYPHACFCTEVRAVVRCRQHGSCPELLASAGGKADYMHMLIGMSLVQHASTTLWVQTDRHVYEAIVRVATVNAQAG